MSTTALFHCRRVNPDAEEEAGHGQVPDTNEHHCPERRFDQDRRPGERRAEGEQASRDSSSATRRSNSSASASNCARWMPRMARSTVSWLSRFFTSRSAAISCGDPRRPAAPCSASVWASLATRMSSCMRLLGGIGAGQSLVEAVAYITTHHIQRDVGGLRSKAGRHDQILRWGNRTSFLYERGTQPGAVLPPENGLEPTQVAHRHWLSMNANGFSANHS